MEKTSKKVGWLVACKKPAPPPRDGFLEFKKCQVQNPFSTANATSSGRTNGTTQRTARSGKGAPGTCVKDVVDGMNSCKFISFPENAECAGKHNGKHSYREETLQSCGAGSLQQRQYWIGSRFGILLLRTPHTPPKMAGPHFFRGLKSRKLAEFQ